MEHIVIIEDDTYFLKVITYLLEEAGYRVTGFTELTNVDELSALKADCFIIDEQLPNVNGHIICIMLKSREQTKYIPVILASAYEGLEGFAGMCKADAFLKKMSFNPEDLLDLVALTIARAAENPSELPGSDNLIVNGD